MTARLSRQRLWIAGLYCLAVVLAQGFHTHHAPSASAGHAGDARHCGAGHPGPAADDGDRDRGPSPALTSCSDDCPACDFALNHQAAPADRVDSPEAARHSHLRFPPPADPDASPARPRSRAPPSR